MKIYVDELPKNCAECPLNGHKAPAEHPEVECMHCNLRKGKDGRSPLCPLCKI